MAKIYVASSWRNVYQQAVVQTLRIQGHEVYDFKNPPKGTGFAWSEIDPLWEKWNTDEYIAALDNKRAVDGFLSDYTGMLWCDTCVMVMPCGRSANTEAGWCKGAGKNVFVVLPGHERMEPELMYSMHNKIFSSLNALYDFTITYKI